jgi:hypothetical protein
MHPMLGCKKRNPIYAAAVFSPIIRKFNDQSVTDGWGGWSLFI